MKKTVTAIILVFCSLLLLSCGNGGQETPSPTAAHEESAFENQTASIPEMDVDDSITFYAKYEYGEDGASPHITLRDSFIKAYSEHMGQYIENLKISGLHYVPLREDNSAFVGYFVFTGTPIDSLGWEQAESYCRSFNICTEDLENWTFAKSYPMDQGSYLNYRIWEDDYTDFKEATPVVGELISAELYVSQLGESYTITANEAIATLTDSLSFELDGDFTYPGTHVNMDCTFVNPLYLNFADGSTRIVLTAGDGSNACYIWDYWYPYNTNKSIFEQFGVSLTAAGYERNGEITTTKSSFDYDSSYPDDEEKYTGSDIRIYDSDGKLMEIHTYWDKAMPVRGVVHDLATLEYDGNGKLIKSDNYSDDVLFTTFIYEYDAQGLLTRRTTVFSNAVDGVESGAGVIEDYKYDDLNRVIEIKSYYPHDEGGPSNSYCLYWYDDDGYRHRYQNDGNGNLVGRDDEPIRREG